ncbi:NifU family protein [Actinocorallia sp. A-T 12471]|uniref:NifU family protein n=1 Tax=Actinocorallia sp. A-T 12471 TaxID=3089813 RepID=UPI0029D3A1C1|nr:NifU family protein [Actinocorallia sp. A-T 12471]MDX6739944.1 NifU family protein [Actinocorallia sp. A-T 12471]
MDEPAPRLDDAAVGERIGRIEAELGALESMPGATAARALDAVALLTQVYGEALARVVDRVDGPVAEALAADELVGHLLVLHGVHPEPLPRRIELALERLRPVLGGGEARLESVADGVARVRLSGARGQGCGGTRRLEDAVRDAVGAIAPELDTVEVRSGDPAFVPVDALLTKPGVTR